MSLDEKLARIEQSILEGEVLKSADRLKNLVNQYPDEAKVWSRLAQLYFDSGFYDAAGLFWILSEPKTEEQRRCVEIYRKSVKNSARKILEDLKFRGNRELLSAFGQRTLNELESRCKDETGYVPKFSPWTQESKKSKESQESSSDKFVGRIIAAVLIFLLICMLLGLFEIVQFIYNLILG